MTTNTCTENISASKASFNASNETLCDREFPTYNKFLEYCNTYQDLYDDYVFLFQCPNDYPLKDVKMAVLESKIQIVYSLVLRCATYYRVDVEVPAPYLIGIELNPGPYLIIIRTYLLLIFTLWHFLNLGALIYDYMYLGIIAYEIYPLWILDVFLLYFIHAFMCCSLRLVGIELNPGPLVREIQQDIDSVNQILHEFYEYYSNFIRTRGSLNPEQAERFMNRRAQLLDLLDTLYDELHEALMDEGFDEEPVDVFDDELPVEVTIIDDDTSEDEEPEVPRTDVEVLTDAARHIYGVLVQTEMENEVDPSAQHQARITSARMVLLNISNRLNALGHILLVEDGNIIVMPELIEDEGFSEDHEDGPLVGIEPNPGPLACASTRKQSKVSKIIRFLERREERCKTIERNSKRDLKYQVEGMFDVKLDEDSKLFFKNIFGNFFRDPTIHVTHTLNIDSTLFDYIHEFVLYVKNLGSRAYKFMIGVLRFILSIIDDGIERMFALFLGEQFYDAQMYQVEMDAPYTLISAFLYDSYFVDFVTQPSWQNFVKTIFMIRQKGIETKNFVEGFRMILMEVCKFVSDITGVDYSEYLENKDPYTVDLEKQIKNLMEEYRKGIKDEYTFCQRVLTVVDELEHTIYRPKRTLQPQTKERLQYVLKKMTPIVNFCERNMNVNNGTRVEPVAIMIAGPTGVGKSTFTTPFVLALLRNVIEKDQIDAFMECHNDFIFYRNTENEFWDGFKRRNIAIIFDDFGQRSDTAGTPNPDAFEIIRLKNMAPYHLHMAKLEEKEKNYACPKIIFCTSNLAQINFNSVMCNEAVVRRFDIAVVQVPKLEFCIDSNIGSSNVWNRRLDMDKVRAKYPEIDSDVSSYFVADVMEYVDWDFVHGRAKSDGKVRNMFELLKYAVDFHRKQEGRGTKMLKYQNYMKQYVVEMNITQKLQDVIYTTLDTLAECNLAANRIYNTINENIPDDLKRFGLITLKLGGIVLSSIKVYENASRIYNSVAGFFFGKNEEQSGNSRAAVTKTTRNVNKATVRSNVAKAAKNIKAQTQAGALDLSVYLKLLKRNQYLLRSEGVILGWVTFICGTVFVVPRHFDDYIFIKENVKVELLNPFSQTVSCTFDWHKDLQLYDEHEDDEEPYDYIIFKLDERKMRMHADISKYFLSQSKMRVNDHFSSQMCVMRNGQLVFLNHTVTYDKDIGYEYETNKYKSRALRYHSDTQRGDCGALLVCMEKRFSKPVILGFHTAGVVSGVFTQKPCLGIFVCKDEIDRALTIFGEMKVAEELDVQSVDFEVEGFSTLSIKPQPRVPNKTKIFPSEMCEDLWETKTKPAHLKRFRNDEGEIIDPAKIARLGYKHNCVYIDSELLSEAMYCVSNMVCKNNVQKPWDPRLFSFEEAVSGIDGVDFVDGIARSTSPGYPYVLSNKSKGKSYWFGSEGKVDFSTAEAREIFEAVKTLIDKASNGIRSENIYIDYLKDERRPIAKVDAGKTRQFMACGMVYLIAVKMYFGDFIRHVCSNRITNGIAVGINPYDEWSNLYEYLQFSRSAVYTAGDYSKYDARIPVEVGNAVLEIVENFYYNSSATDRVVRRILFQDIINSIHISEGKVYEFVGGNPSGQPLTAIFNSIANLLIITYCARCIYQNSGSENSFENIIKNTRFQVFGDDNIISYLPQNAFLFDQSILQEAMPVFVGMDYTNENKDGTVKVARGIHEISFLKRMFRAEEGRVFAPLDIDVLKETLSWRKSDTTLEEMQLRIDCVCSEFAQHGKQVFDEHVPCIVRSSIKNYDYIPKYKDYVLARDAHLSLNI